MRTKILYEDEQLLVIHKPAGLATQTAKIGQPDVVSELKNYLKAPYLGIVHRLDQPVEGLLVFGKTKAAASALTKQLGEGVLNKNYYAVVCGKITEESGELVDYLTKTADNRAEIFPEGNGTIAELPDRRCETQKDKRTVLQNRRMENSPQTVLKDAGKAVLQYHILERAEAAGKEIALADIRIETGRFHQIRAQMAHAGMPLLGDSKYGTAASIELSRNLQVRNVALCACFLQIRHPKTGKILEFCVRPEAQIFQKFGTVHL